MASSPTGLINKDDIRGMLPVACKNSMTQRHRYMKH